MKEGNWNKREKVMRRSVLEGLKELLRKTRLRWFGHVRGEEHMLRRALNFETESRRPSGRPKKTWRKKEGKKDGKEGRKERSRERLASKQARKRRE